MAKSIFQASFLDQKKTIETLLKESRDGNEYYFLLGLATFIATLGLVINNAFVILGGMLIAPILFPILSVGMGVVTSSRLAIIRGIKTTLKSMLLVLVISIGVAFVFNTNEFGREVLTRIEPNLILFLISFAAGLAVAYSWVKQELSAVLPGIAVAESLLPPLAVTGMGLATGNAGVMAGSFTLFLINFLGVVLSAIVIFSLFGFSKLQTEEEVVIVEEEFEKKIQKAALVESGQLNNNKNGEIKEIA